jgi:hypothetical protein
MNHLQSELTDAKLLLVELQFPKRRFSRFELAKTARLNYRTIESIELSALAKLRKGLQAAVPGVIEAVREDRRLFQRGQA